MNSEIEKRVDLFKKKCDKLTLINCYKNKLEFGCGYCEEIEKFIKNISDQIEEEVGPPWWVHLLD
jgi:hypothetical protein